MTENLTTQLVEGVNGYRGDGLRISQTVMAYFDKFWGEEERKQMNERPWSAQCCNHDVASSWSVIIAAEERNKQGLVKRQVRAATPVCQVNIICGVS